MVLQPQRHPLRVWLVSGPLMMCSWARQFDMVLDKHTVVKGSDKSGAKEFPRFANCAVQDQCTSLGRALPHLPPTTY